MSYVGALLCLLAAMVLAPALLLLVQVIVAWPAGKRGAVGTAASPRTAVLIPAHNEALMIAGTVRALTEHLSTTDRLLVVADNCTDETARIARGAGAEVIERRDPDRRGKIYAINFGVRYLEQSPPDVVLIVDADCRFHDGAIKPLVTACGSTRRPVQAVYLMQAPADSSLAIRIAEFAWLFKNRIRAIALDRLGLPCHLTGSGMAFPWDCIRHLRLNGDYVAEDYKLGLDVADAGTPASLCADAVIVSFFPANTEGQVVQRIRWEHGHLALIASLVPRRLVSALWKGDFRQVALLVDMSVPPLSLLVVTAMMVTAAALIYYVLTGAALPLMLIATALAVLAAVVLMAWGRFARNIIPLHELVYAPVYALKKIPLYFRFVVNRQVEWIRSRRDGE